MNLSEPQLISPLLDGFVMGDPISGHDGVRACPAMQLETDKKYIVKIISLPASQSKLDALLLAGAFTDRESAVDYFKELADGVIEEAELLQKLSRHEGFVAFENWQMVPMDDDETGYDIYLLGQYRPTLENVIRNNEMTHLQAINLGLDLCAALSASRRFGYLYSNLRPSNIYLCNEREFRIGDLGFLSLDSLQYASLPDKYHSDYTPPEISDAYSALNSTMDTYAVGLILYQVYNDGRLPVVGASVETPCHADPALSEIIMKACASDPADRWPDPVQMGQALANYLQSNTVNDVPIVPVAEEVEASEPEEIFPDEDTQPSTDDILAEVDQALETAPPLIVSPVAEVVPAETEPEEPAEEISDEPVAETADESLAELPDEEPDEIIDQEEIDEGESEETAEDIPQDEPDVDEVSEDAPVVDETAQILAQADDLIAHQLPDPPVAPEPFEVTLPKKEEPEPESDDGEMSSEQDASGEDSDAESTDESTTVPDSDEESGTEDDEELLEDAQDDTPKPKNKRKGLIVTAIILAVVLLLGTAAVLFYQQFYLQTIHNMELIGIEDQLTVQLTTDVADEKLTVKCSDTHGNTLIANVENGAAHFSGLRSGTVYTLEVRIDGFHKLLGETTVDYATTAQTVINGFYAVTGPEDGSVILSFTPQGPSSAQWTVKYSTEGEQERSSTFAGHMVTLTGLTIGKEYTFTLEPVSQLYLSGTDTITHTVSAIVYAQNLNILSFQDGELTLTWEAPEGITVPQWYVRCYNDSGFDQSLTTEETTATLTDMDISAGYTIEVTAEGMSLGSRTYLSPDSILITGLKADSSNRTQLNVTWEFEGTAPADGWLLLYTIDGSSDQQVITCDSNSATIKPLVPGATYHITVQPSGSTTAFGGELEYSVPEAPAFSGYLVTAEDMEFSMCKTPDKKDWDRKDVSDKNYTTSFKVGVSASFVMHVNQKTSQTQDMVTTLYVIRDIEDELVSANTESRTWDDMWDNRYGELTIPVMPEEPGKYTVEIYFNGTAATTQSFEILASN